MMALHPLPLLLALVAICCTSCACAPTRGTPLPPYPYIIDQAASTISSDDVDGFSASRLRSYGVNIAAAGSIDCTSTLDAIPGGSWYNASGLAYVAKQVSSVRAMVAAGQAAGLRVLLSSDIFQLPSLLFEHYAQNVTVPGVSCIGYRRGPTCISIRSNFTQSVLRALFDEMLETFPGIGGLVLRYGENSPCAYHQGNAPYDATSLNTTISSLTELLLFLRAELAVARNITVLFRTWDTNTSLLHANPAVYEAVIAGVPPHPNLVFAIKHTMLDFWRRVRFNPTLGVGAHPQVVEAEVGGMYAMCGTVPLYVGAHIISSYPEDAALNLSRGLTWLEENQATPGSFAGILMNHQCTSSPAAPDPWIWWRLEEAVLAGWAASPSTPEPEIFDSYVRTALGIADANARRAFRNLTLTAMDANLAIATCEAFDSTLLEVDRPSANWFLLDGVGGLEQLANNTCNAALPSHCELLPWLVAHGQLDAAVAEKAAAAATYAALNTTAHQDIAPAFSNTTLARAFLASVEAGAWFSAAVAGGWAAMLYGWAGDASGGATYNVSAIRAGIAAFDAARIEYEALPKKYGSLAPGLMNFTHWQHATSGVPGMAQSVDRYRHL